MSPLFVLICNTLTTASRCLHSLCSVDMTALAAFATLVCLRHCVFLCKGTKAAKSYAFCVILQSRILGTVCRFPLLRLETPVLATALCKSSRIRRSRILGIVCRFPLLRLVAPVLPTAFVPVRYGLLQTGRVLLYFSLSFCIISLYFPVFFLSAF